MSDGAAALREHLRRRVTEQGLKTESLRGGLKAIYYGNGSGRPIAATLAAVDAFMGWQPGSARQVFDGGDPILVEPQGDYDADLAEILDAMEATSDSLDQASATLRAVARAVRGRRRAGTADG